MMDTSRASDRSRDTTAAVETRPTVVVLAASIMTFLTAAGLLLRFPYAPVESPGEMAGLAMAFAGLAFVLIALGWLKTTTGPTA